MPLEDGSSSSSTENGSDRCRSDEDSSDSDTDSEQVAVDREELLTNSLELDELNAPAVKDAQEARSAAPAHLGAKRDRLRDSSRHQRRYREERRLGHPATSGHRGWWRTLFGGVFVRHPSSVLARTLVVLSTALVAVFAGASFGNFMSLIGSLGAASLAYCVPSYMHYRVLAADREWYWRAKDALVFLFGVTAALVGTAVTLYEIIHTDSSKPS